MSRIPASDELLRRLLAADDDAAAPPTEHPDDETLALFADGALVGAERNPVVAHLAACSHCRQVVAAAMIVAGEHPQVVPLTVPKPRWFAARPVLALAASLLLAVGVTWLVMLSRTAGTAEGNVYHEVAMLITDRHFEQAKQRLSAASADGVSSPRLRSLQAEAAREIPSVIALDHAGALTDFGYDYGGVAARGPSDEIKKGLNEANDLLVGAGTDDLDVLLNRGHLRLTRGEPKLGVADFQMATRTAGNRAEAWLGLGLAQFMLDNFAAAEAAFRTCLELDPENTTARINLAMTLEEENQIPAALNTWQAVLASDNVSGQQRQQIERHVAELNGSKGK